MNGDFENTPETLDPETLKPPSTRAGDANAIRGRVSEIRRQDDRVRAKRRKVMQLIYDGEPPYSAEKLRARGMADRTNINWREAEGYLEQQKTPYYSVVFRQPLHATIRCSYGNNPQQQDDCSTTISQHFHWMLTQWKSHSYNVQLRDWQMCFFGVGIPMFTDDESPFWEAKKISEVLVPDDTPADIEQVAEGVSLRKIDPVTLFKMVDKASAKDMGWFVERAKRAIVDSAPETLSNSYGGRSWNEEYAKSLRCGDASWNSASARIPITDYFIKEFSGKVTHCILLDNGTSGETTTADGDDAGLIFRKVERFECFAQIFQPFFFDIGTGEWHSIKGLGPKIRDFCEVSNRFTCSMVDGARIGAGILLKASDGTALQKTQLIEVTGANIVQPGFDIQQNRIGEALQGPVTVMREIQNKLQNNTGQYLRRVSNENAEPTLGQAQLNERNQAQLSDAALDRHMGSMDWLYFEQVRRAITLGMKLFKRQKTDEVMPIGKMPESYCEAERLSLGFVQRCIRDGVPEEALDMEKIESVKATRGVGGGSPAAVDMATQQGLALLPMLDENGRNIVLGLRASYLFGQSLGREIVPPFDTAQQPTGDRSFATLENNALRVPGGVALVAYDQDHLVHFDAHFADVGNHLKALQAGQSQPQDMLTHLEGFGPHARRHLDSVKGDPSRKAQLAQREQQWVSMSKVADQLKQQIAAQQQAQARAQQQAQKQAAAQAQQQAQEQAQRPDPDLIAKMAKVRGDLELKAHKQQGDMALKADKQKTTMHLKDLETAHKLRLNNLDAASSAMMQMQQDQQEPESEPAEIGAA